MGKNNPPSSPSPLLNQIWPTLVVILAALGIPGAAIVGFITQHSWTALVIGIFYEIGVFLLSFVGKVWGKLEDPLVDHTATWIISLVQTGVSRYRKQYYRYLCNQHRDFDVRGLSTQGPYGLELDQVFIELSIHTITPQEATANPIQLPHQLREGSHAIWDYLAAAPLSKQHLVIIGPPGSGKTTILKHIALTLANHRRAHHQIKVPHKLPILLFLRDHATSIKDKEHFTLVDAIQEHLKKWDQPVPPQNWFARKLAKGQCIVMLDGLDEIADSEARKQLVNWVDRQISAQSKNRFLITSRPFGYKSNPLRGVTVLQVEPFTTEQVERFVQKWYLANEIMSKQKNDSGVRMRARADAKSLLQQLRNTPALFDLTANPLLLTMITTIHRYGGGGKLPNNRVALYTEICQVFLGKRQEARGQVLELTPAQMQLVLEPLAYHLMVTEKREIELDEVSTVIEEPLSWVSTHMTAATFLLMVERVSGLLLERENGVYSFAHLTFQEFLAASYIREQQRGDILITKVGEPWWRETIRLYCAMADATSIIATCLEIERPSASALELAIDCDNEALKVRPEVRTKLEALLIQNMEDPDPDRQHVIAEALLARRLRSMVYVKDQIDTDTKLIGCAEYQLFLDERRAQGLYLQPDHWTSYHFPSGQGGAPVLGVRSSDAEAFCEWLTLREQGHRQYRLPRANELDTEGISDRLPADSGYWLEGARFEWTTKASAQPTTILEEIFADALDRDLNLFISSESEHIEGLASNRVRATFQVGHTHTLTHSLSSPISLILSVGKDSMPSPVISRAIDLRVLPRDHDSNAINTLASSLDLTLVPNLASSLDPDHTLARTLALADTLALAIDDTLAVDDIIARSIFHVIDDRGSLVINLDSSNPIGMIHSFDIVRNPNRDIALALVRKFVNEIIDALNRALDCCDISALKQAINHASSLKRTLESTNALDHHYTIDDIRDLTILLASDLASVTALAPTDQIIAYSLISASKKALAVTFVLSGILTMQDNLERAGSYFIDCARVAILADIYNFYSAKPPTQEKSFSKILLNSLLSRTKNQFSPALIDDCLRSYADLVKLQARIEGQLPAYEGILIVKH